LRLNRTLLARQLTNLTNPLHQENSSTLQNKDLSGRIVEDKMIAVSNLKHCIRIIWISFTVCCLNLLSEYLLQGEYLSLTV